MRKAVSSHGELQKSLVPGDLLHHVGLNLFREVIVLHFHNLDLLVHRQNIDQSDHVVVTQFAMRKIKLAELSLRQYRSESVEGTVEQEVAGTGKRGQSSIGQDIAQMLEAYWSNLVQRDVKLLQLRMLG